MANGKNKAAAREWKQETEQAARAKEEMSDQWERLRYEAEKRNYDSYPCADTFAANGHGEAASKINQAIRLLREAYDLKPGDE
jgi:hypothetical protein